MFSLEAGENIPYIGAMKSTREILIDEITTFSETTGISVSRIGEVTANDKKLLNRLRAGRDVTTATADKIRAYISENNNKSLPAGEPS